MAVWPEVLAAQQHAHSAAAASTRLETLDADTAAEIEALAAQILPSTGGPGARETGVVYFIDRALGTFASDERGTYRTGMAQFQAKRKELFPKSASIASLSDQQQMTLIRSMETSEFFEVLRTHTVLGFLGDPKYGGNRGTAGWRQIGFEDAMVFEHPFGYYDTAGKP
jgi:gluconate 2-dehydrogenase gamma chain